jgi:hypothetical protein
VSWRLHSPPAVAVMLAFLSSVAPAQSAIPALEEGCRDDTTTTLLSTFATVELGVAAGSGIPPDRRDLYRATAEAVLACARPGAHVTVRPITEHAATEVPIFAALVPDRTGENKYNGLHYLADRRAYLKRAMASLDQLSAIGLTDRGSDPLGALMAASRDMSPGAKAIVILICNGWQQTRELNVFAYRRDPAAYAASAIKILSAHGMMPDLTGVRVTVAGLTSGSPSMKVTDTQLAGLCQFWKSVVEAAHGVSGRTDCVPNLPGSSVPRPPAPQVSSKP